jgi:hypothetical protein
VDFSKARDLFVNIFQILDLTAKIMDRGVILENTRGLSAKSAKSGPRVDFTKVRGTRLGPHQGSSGAEEAGRQRCRTRRRQRSMRGLLRQG